MKSSTLRKKRKIWKNSVNSNKQNMYLRFLPIGQTIVAFKSIFNQILIEVGITIARKNKGFLSKASK